MSHPLVVFPSRSPERSSTDSRLEQKPHADGAVEAVEATDQSQEVSFTLSGRESEGPSLQITNEVADVDASKRVVPEVSYSSSEDEDFYDAEEGTGER